MFQDLTSLIINIGTNTSKFGYGGDDAPKIITPSFIGKSSQNQHSQSQMIPQQSQIQMINKNQQSYSKYLMGSQLTTNSSNHIEIQSIFHTQNNDGSILSPKYQIDYDKYQSFIAGNIVGNMHVNLSQYSILISQDIATKPHQLRENRAKIAQIMFQKLKVPNIYFLKNPVLSCFATGRSTALILDSGQNFTRSVAVHDGYTLLKSVKTVSIGGKHISNQVQKYVQKLSGKPLHTRFDILSQSSSSPTKYPKSFMEFHKHQLIRDIKEHISVKSNDQMAEEVQKVQYELPDRKIITIDKNQILDPFISPSDYAKNSLCGNQHNINFDISYKGFPQMIIESINSCDVDIKKQLFSNLLMCGGNVLYGNLMKQIEQKVNELAPPNAKVKTVAVCSPNQRKYSEWIGGSIVTSLSSFQSYWIGQQQWKENGASIIEKKCP